MIPHSSPWELLFLLLCGHALADFALQTEFVATNKNRHIRHKFEPDIRSKMQVIWPHLMLNHCLHHGLMVFIITKSLTLALAEVAVHFVTDYGKCERWYGFHGDQFIHIATKVAWTVIVTQGWMI